MYNLHKDMRINVQNYLSRYNSIVENWRGQNRWVSETTDVNAPERAPIFRSTRAFNLLAWETTRKHVSETIRAREHGLASR